MKSSTAVTHKSYGHLRRLIVVAVVAVLPLLGLCIVHSQNPTNPPLQGETRRVVLAPNTTVNAGEIKFRADTDSDGMPDEDEENNGTDPEDPADADTDADNDGLTNGDEVGIGSGVNNSDTDGDGVSDGTEAGLGYSPIDPTSTPPAGAALASLQVTPNPINLGINTLLGQQPVELRVIGVRTDGTTTDLTGSPTLTFESLDPSIALVDDFGTVAGLRAGQTTIRVTSGTVTTDVPAVVTVFTPSTLSETVIPGYANNVDVAQDYAYVAAGAAGLVIVNINDPANPVIVATLDTPGNANDVRVVGNTAYVADGSSGLQIIDVTTPASPSILSSVNTTGEATDVVVQNMRAYVADGDAGLRIIDVSNPSAPTTLGAVNTPGIAWGVAVSGDFAVVADQDSVLIIDAAIPATPSIVGVVDMPFGFALDLEVVNRFAYVATYGGGLQLVDFSVPTDPRNTAGAFGFFLRDVALANRYAVGAEAAFLNSIPIFDLGDPGDPTYRALLNLSTSGSFSGTGLAINGQQIYMTATSGGALKNGTTGDTRLFIVAYQAPETGVSDTAGIAPTVTVDSPQTGQSTTEGSRLPISIKAVDDVKVELVQLIVNGVVVIQDVAAPYNITSTVPRGVTSITIEARAFDTAGNNATSPPVTINVLPDPPPTIEITSPAEGQILAEGEYILLTADATDNGNITQVVFNVNGETFDNYSYYLVPTGISSLTFEATATDDFGHSTSTTRTVSVIPDPPPTVNIVAPAAGTQLTQGQVVQFIVEATDNAGVEQVEFSFNGTVAAIDYDTPYAQFYTVPTGITSLLFEARAQDNLGQPTVASRSYDVVPDPGTTVTGQVVDSSAQPIAGATVSLFGEFTTQTAANGTFSIPNAPTVRGDILARVTATLSGQPAANASLPIPPVSGGTTNVGVIALSVSPAVPTAFAMADFNNDFATDILIGYPDRQSLIYSVSGSQFAPNANFLLPFGALSSGTNLSVSGAPSSDTSLSLNLNFGSIQQFFGQLSGRPASVVDLSFDNGTMQTLKTVATGLTGESDFTAAGLDTNGLSNNPTVAAFLTSGSGPTALTVRFGDDSPEGFGAPLALPVDSAVPLRSLALADINNDSLLDVIVVKPVSGDQAKLVVYLRTSASTFGSAIETSITVRNAAPARGAVDFVVGRFAGNFNQDVAVLGDDRVRIYTGNGTGGFVSSGQALLPAGKLATGLTTYDLRHDGRSDLIVTTSDTTTPTAKQLLVYRQVSGDAFLSPVTTAYTAPVSAGDTRVGIGEWGGGFRNLDMVVVDGETVTTLIDCGGPASGS